MLLGHIVGTEPARSPTTADTEQTPKPAIETADGRLPG
jgi:hypothetical protein